MINIKLNFWFLIEIKRYLIEFKFVELFLSFIIIIYYFKVTDGFQISDIKKSINKIKSSLYPDRQSIRLEAKGKSLKDSDNVKDLGKN